MRTVRPLALLAGTGLLLSGCATFDDTAAHQTYSAAPSITPEHAPDPGGPSGSDAGPAKPGSTSRTPIPPPQGCKDFDEAVIATCLDPVSAVAGIPSDGTSASALAGERKTGRILLVATGKDPVVMATVPVDASGDGGLTGLALSPAYGEDQLFFAYITTPSDNRVVRLAKGQAPKPVLTGIPKGATGNHGALMRDAKGGLLVATGDAGNPAAAADPNSLAGKILRIDVAGQPFAGNPTAGSPVFAAGLHAPGGLCASDDGARLWVTDRQSDKDVVYRVEAGKPFTSPAWSWPEKPGVYGCDDSGRTLGVAATSAANMQILPLSPEGAVTSAPFPTFDGKKGPTYGRLGPVSPINADFAVMGTLNKDGGTPVSSDDRVVIISRKALSSAVPGKD
ncbi:Glucose/arabinose dehydrogenase, beta-propeller fold [Amycolatopsis xylanica]|uniref:Glucose/arabinose dehydrogenase, beta-propeller fold n=1 Tax=Amycolatopsis xylanica TaxID=589385 RepID=A0A1H3CY61_9PSEU|nr:PQQ-dependent sugar dehydrogenase [Amycolatopsis xylanica]SDX59075.1 Glucose/arabinose dehydrogenase, beta-propeller fold [Amycolatopsis xylanica]